MTNLMIALVMFGTLSFPRQVVMHKSTSQKVSVGSGVSSVEIFYRRETDNYNVPVTPTRLLRFFNAEIVLNQAASVADVASVVESVQLGKPYSGPIDVSWGIVFRKDLTKENFGVYLDRTRVHAIISGHKYVIAPELGNWLISKFGCLRHAAYYGSPDAAIPR